MNREYQLWHSYDSKELSKHFSTSLSQGLLEGEAQERLNKNGSNSFVKEDKYRLIKLFFGNFHHLLIYVLFAAALISYFAEELIEFYVILAIIAVTIFLSFFQQFSADRIVKALNSLKPANVQVIRDGKKQSIKPEDIVIGDIVFLQRGDIIPADMRVIESSGLSVDESTLTGESVAKGKSNHVISKADVEVPERTNCVFASTSVTGGSGKGLVYATGFQTEIGKLSESIQDAKSEKSPLQRKVDQMSKQISIIVLCFAFLIFILLIMNQVELSIALLIVGAVVVAGIPESFPLALTSALSKGVKQMADKNALLKNLNSVETLGNTTVICTDKTGTLTENKMMISKLNFSLKENFDVKGEAYVPDYIFYSHKKEKPETVARFEKFFTCSILCNDAILKNENGKWNLDGEPTEGAFISLSQALGYDEVECRNKYHKIHEIAFSPEKKYMVALHKEKKTGNHLVSMKGAAERVLNKCTHYRNEKGKSVVLNNLARKKFHSIIENHTMNGFRVMAVASKNIKKENDMKKHLENSFTLEGVVAIVDPIRDEVADAVKTCTKAGIKTVMITGDHKYTATSIASQIGIVNSDYDLIITGEELAELDDKQLDKKISRIRVFSRVSPEDKYRIIESFQRNGEIVAMTGDGVNDAPALKEADIGVSMGKNGTEVAREASDMILLDDNFSTIVTAVREGRTIYSNVRRFSYALISTNFALVSLILVSILLGYAYMLPLTALMVLFINIVTNTFPALALSVEPTHANIMEFKPRNPKERILSRYILTKILVIFPIMTIIALFVFMWELQTGSSLEKAMTLTFLTMVFLGMFHSFNARKLHTSVFSKDFNSNPYIFMSIGFSALLTMTVITTEFGRELFEVVLIDIQSWLFVIGMASLIIIFSEMMKLSTKVEFQEQSAMRGVKNYLE